MVSSLSSARPLDSPRFSSLFFISSCRDAPHHSLKQDPLLAGQGEGAHLADILLREAMETELLPHGLMRHADHVSPAVRFDNGSKYEHECWQLDS